MYLIAQSTFADLFYTTYSGITNNAQNKVQSILLAVVNQLIEQNNGTIANKPTGLQLKNQQQNSTAGTTSAQITTYFNSKPTPSTNITLVGETHGNPQDIARANAIIAAINATVTPAETLVVYERGLTYPGVHGVELVNENNLATGPRIPTRFYEGLTPENRSYMVAAYLVARAACGNQAVKNNILLFFGQRHSDIFTFFDRISGQCGSGSHLLAVPRNYNLIVSNA